MDKSSSLFFNWLSRCLIEMGIVKSEIQAPKRLFINSRRNNEMLDVEQLYQFTMMVAAFDLEQSLVDCGTCLGHVPNHLSLQHVQHHQFWDWELNT